MNIENWDQWDWNTRTELLLPPHMHREIEREKGNKDRLMFTCTATTKAALEHSVKEEFRLGLTLGLSLPKIVQTTKFNNSNKRLAQVKGHRKQVLYIYMRLINQRLICEKN